MAVLQHLLNWIHQPGQRSRSWQLTIAEQRCRILKILEANPALRARRDMLFESAYGDVRKLAAAETGLQLQSFPPTPRFSREEAEDDGFMPH